MMKMVGPIDGTTNGSLVTTAKAHSTAVRKVPITTM